jgi:hypothetical protein
MHKAHVVYPVTDRLRFIICREVLVGLSERVKETHATLWVQVFAVVSEPCSNGIRDLHRHHDLLALGVLRVDDGLALREDAPIVSNARGEHCGGGLSISRRRRRE